MKKQNIYKVLTIFFVVQVLFIAVISRFPRVVESYYSNGIYPVISSIFRKVFGWIPFSIGDVYYFLLGVFLIFSIYSLFKNKFRNLKEILFRFGAYISIFYFLFNLFWGLNYHKDSLFNTLELKQKQYALPELIELTNDLVELTKNAHFQITQNDSVKIDVQHSEDWLINQVHTGYDSLSIKFPQFKYHNTSIKKSLFSLPLTYMGFSGYFNPISGEAQVDYLVPKINLPMIGSHEVAHQLGYASESEANFIGYLAATHHTNDYFKFSGYSAALRYSIKAVYGMDSIKGRQIINDLPKGITKTFKESQEFWQSYQNKAEPFFKLFYDNYLKANQQKDGMQGYSKMVGLLVAYREKYSLY